MHSVDVAAADDRDKSLESLSICGSGASEKAKPLLS